MKIVSIDYGPGMDREIVSLCDVLNSLHGIYTVESCAGHGKAPMSVLFVCKSLKSLAKIQHAIDIRYSGQKNPWRIVCHTTDTPQHGTSLLFDLSSEGPYRTKPGRRHEYEPSYYHDLLAFECSIELYSTRWGEAFVQRRQSGPCPYLVWKKYTADIEAVKGLYSKHMEMSPWAQTPCKEGGKA